ncbi:WD40 repeat domain-containing protein [Streptomyces sp. NPDC093252]|uniref:WD40 repeat domain-containing protein n=1 Tax=Streptomyces sp. NPDC093252 TaxID=3154980 RepID=UPI00342EB046
MRRSLVPLAATALLTGGLLALPSTASAADGDEGFTIEDPRITESSGLAASRQHPGIYWTHNDSDDGAFLYAVDSATGETVATLTLTGVGTPRDVEAISIGPGNQIYVGDIGDNLGGTWDHVWIYQLPEPAELTDRTVRATQYVVQYEDGARDAESLVVHPETGRVYVVDKNAEGGHLYEGPAELSPSGTNVFKPIAAVPDLEATDATLSPDARYLVVRSYFGAVAYTWNGGQLKRLERLSVPTGFVQGESVTYTADGNRLMYGAEGEGSKVLPEDPPGDGGGGSADSAAGAEDSGSGAGDGRDLSVGAGALGAAVVALLVLGARRRRRRG